MRRLVVALLLTVTACGGTSTEPGGPDTVAWTASHTSTHWWMSVAAVSGTDQLIVGGTTTDGAILRFDGSTVTEVEHGTGAGLLNWVHRFEDGSLVVVGNDGAVLHSDGETWWDDEPVTDQDLWGVWGASPDDVWAVGGDADGGTATILRNTGSGFEPIPIPEFRISYEYKIPLQLMWNEEWL